jgi:hypothetical protein
VPALQNQKEPHATLKTDGPLHVGITQPKGNDFQNSIPVHRIKEGEDSNGLIAKKPPSGKTYHPTDVELQGRFTDGTDLK